MNITKEETGITLVALVITIIILIILAGISIPMGINQSVTARDTKYLAELGIVKQIVYEQYVLYNKTKNASLLKGEEVSQGELDSVVSSMGITLQDITAGKYNAQEMAYYRLDNYILKELGVKNPVHIYIVNYVTGEVLNESIHKTKTGDPLYTH